ncbi:hypothetical protein ACOMHN_034485 [Nucella lapillus]
MQMMIAPDDVEESRKRGTYSKILNFTVPNSASGSFVYEKSPRVRSRESSGDFERDGTEGPAAVTRDSQQGVKESTPVTGTKRGRERGKAAKQRPLYVH